MRRVAPTASISVCSLPRYFQYDNMIPGHLIGSSEPVLSTPTAQHPSRSRRLANGKADSGLRSETSNSAAMQYYPRPPRQSRQTITIAAPRLCRSRREMAQSAMLQSSQDKSPQSHGSFYARLSQYLVLIQRIWQRCQRVVSSLKRTTCHLPCPH